MSDSRVFYGWVIVAVAFIVDFIAVGFFFYSYGVFFLPISEELGGGSRFGVNMGIALVNGVGAIIAPWVGNALDRYSIKRIMAIGVCVSTIGFACLSLVESMGQFYIVLVCLTAIGTATMGQLATGKLVANWFVAKRGTALGIATMGVSLSGVIMPGVTTWLIDQFGWRGSLEIFSVATFVIVMPIVLLYVVNNPEDKDQEPDGRARLPLSEVPLAANQISLGWKDILKMRSFWGATITFGLIFCGMGATLTNMIPLAIDLGIDKYHAANVLAVGALTGVVGKIFFGILSDRANIRSAVLWAIGTQWIGIAMISHVENFWPFVIASAIFGFGMGGVVPLHAAVVGSLFGRRGFGKVMGLMRPMMLPLQVLGLPLAGWVYDTNGSYNLAFYSFLFLLIVSALTTIYLIPKERLAE
ncbi:MAG: MFS transporter [Cellvibrionaceae bacterium]